MGASPGRNRTANAASGRCEQETRSAPPRGVRASPRGFTLLELMIVVVVAAILLAIGVPFFGEFARNNRLTASANDFLSAAQLARTEAIKRQQVVSICASANPGAGAAAACSGGEFSGWIVFPDADSDCARAAGEPVIAAGGVDHSSVLSRANGACASFSAAGFAISRPPGVEVDRLLFCDQRGIALQAGTDRTTARGVVLTRAGRPALTRDADVIATWGFGCP